MPQVDNARRWVSVGRDVVLIGLGVFIVVYDLVWGAPPRPAVLLAGIGLVVGGRRTLINAVNGK